MDQNQATSTLKTLSTASDDFFSRHWHCSDGEPHPHWNEPWRFVGTLHGHDCQGVYALLDGRLRVLYIGVGASYGKGIYAGHGLGSRISNYWRVAEGQAGVPIKQRQYKPTDLWAGRGLTSIATLVIPKPYAYLAYALEAWLLHRVETPFNRQRPIPQADR